jgi:Spy/CpxP family protein refolding chaperone
MSVLGRMISFVVVLGTLLGTTAKAAEQGPPAGRSDPGAWMRGFGGVGLLQSERVQKELKLTDEQLRKLTEMNERFRQQRQEQRQEQFAGVENLSREERRQRFEKIRTQLEANAKKRLEDMRKEIAAILNPEQQKRWRQIELQMEGPSCMLRPEIAEALSLNDDQKKQIEQANRETFDKIRKLFQEIREGDPNTRTERMEQLREKSKKLQAEGDTKATAALKPEQKQKLGEIMGEPFPMERLMPPPPRREGGWGPGRESPPGNGPPPPGP